MVMKKINLIQNVDLLRWQERISMPYIISEQVFNKKTDKQETSGPYSSPKIGEY